jgi:hypothetical protein
MEACKTEGFCWRRGSSGRRGFLRRRRETGAALRDTVRNNGPHVIPQPAGAQLHVPAGFSVGVYAENFERPRYMLLGPSGELLLSDAADGPNGTVYAMPLNKADGYQAHDRKKLITGWTALTGWRSGTSIFTWASRNPSSAISTTRKP